MYPFYGWNNCSTEKLSNLPKSQSWEVKDLCFKSKLPNFRDFSPRDSLKCYPLKFLCSLLRYTECTENIILRGRGYRFLKVEETYSITKYSSLLEKHPYPHTILLDFGLLIPEGSGTMLLWLPSRDSSSLKFREHERDSEAPKWKLGSLGLLCSVPNSQLDLWQIIQLSCASASLPFKVGLWSQRSILALPFCLYIPCVMLVLDVPATGPPNPPSRTVRISLHPLDQWQNRPIGSCRTAPCSFPAEIEKHDLGSCNTWLKMLKALPAASGKSIVLPAWTQAPRGSPWPLKLCLPPWGLGIDGSQDSPDTGNWPRSIAHRDQTSPHPRPCVPSCNTDTLFDWKSSNFQPLGLGLLICTMVQMSTQARWTGNSFGDAQQRSDIWQRTAPLQQIILLLTKFPRSISIVYILPLHLCPCSLVHTKRCPGPSPENRSYMPHLNSFLP